MRPFVTQRPAWISDVIPTDGRLAVVTDGGIDWLGAALEPTARTALPKGGSALSLLGDGRLLWHSERFGAVWVGTERGPWEQVRVGGEEYASGTLVTPGGFLAWTQHHLLVDVQGNQQLHAQELVLLQGATGWGARAALATSQALLVVSGTSLLVHPMRCTGAPAAVGDRLFVPVDDGEIAVLDATLQEVGRAYGERVFAWGADAVTIDRGIVSVLSADDVKAFSIPAVSHPYACGEQLVLGSWEAEAAWVFDRRTREVTQRSLPGRLRAAAPLGDGLVCIDTVSSAATWWRADGTEVALPHDFTPRLLREVPGGVASVDENVLYLWRPGQDGPPPVAAAEGPPLGERVVVQGSTLRVQARGRFASRAVAASGAPRRVPNDAPWRRACEAPAARAVVARLLARELEGVVPAIPGDPLASTAFELTQRPVEESVVLHARALFARDRLTDREQFAADTTRSSWLEELGAALGVSPRALRGAVLARQFPLQPPQELAGFEYVGAFWTDGALVVSDPCHFGKKSPGHQLLSLSLAVPARAGTWHAYLRAGVGEDSDRTAELLVTHAEGLWVPANIPLGSVGVDSGQVGVYDARCVKPEPQRDEGIFHGQGAVANSGPGDGHYPVFTGSSQGQVVKVRAWFLGPLAPELDASVRKPGSRTYSPKERFEIGETLEHPTFGVGSVARERGDGKIEVHFADTVRVLVHRRR